MAKRMAWILAAALTVAGSACGWRSRPVMAPLPPLGAYSEPISKDPSDAYRLLPGDVVRVKFLYHPELDAKVPVRPDGSIDILGVGQLRAEGKTAEELAREIEQMSSEYLRDPEVTVIVADLGAHKVYVMGEVRSPGPVVYREGMTALQAIIDRGGFTDFARTDSVLRLRWRKDDYAATRLDLSRNLSEGKPDQTTLAVNDVIYVPSTFVGDANRFVQYYIRGLLPTTPRASLGVGFNP